MDKTLDEASLEISDRIKTLAKTPFDNAYRAALANKVTGASGNRIGSGYH